MYKHINCQQFSLELHPQTPLPGEGNPLPRPLPAIPPPTICRSDWPLPVNIPGYATARNPANICYVSDIDNLATTFIQLAWTVHLTNKWLEVAELHVHHQNGRLTLSALELSEASLLKFYAGCRSSEAGCWRRCTSGFVSYGGRHFSWATTFRVHFVRRQTLQPIEDGPELLASNGCSTSSCLEQRSTIWCTATIIHQFSWRSPTLAGWSWRPTSRTLAGRSCTSDTTVSFAIVDCCERGATVC